MLAESWSLLVGGLVFAFFMFSILWIVQVVRKDAGVVDIGWTAGVGVMAVCGAMAGDGWVWRRIVVAGLAAAWSLRLVWYILVDRVLTEQEDGRYRRMRSYWGERANLYFYFFFVAQSLLVVLFFLPLLPLVQNTRPAFGIWEVAGVVLWLVAVGGESIADQQLARFRAEQGNRGKTCRRGLWRYSRHPNYFFEWLHWWAYVLFAVGVEGWWLTLVGPVVMFLFLMRLTGIPYTEKQALASRGEDYRDYQETTSMFIPLPPRKKKS